MRRLGALLSVGKDWLASQSEADTSPVVTEELRVTGFHDPPYLMVTQEPNGTFSYGGYLHELWEIIARELGLRYRLVSLPGGGYGSVNANGTWEGMVGELAYGRADVALTWLRFREDRAAVVHYIDAVSVEQDQYSFYVAQGPAAVPELTPATFSSLLQPLHVHVWWTIVASLLVIAVVLRASLRVSGRRAEGQLSAAEHMSWDSCLLSSFMTVVWQGWASTPRSLAARAVTLSSWILGMLIYFNYTANLISHLTVTTVSKPISSLREFSEQAGWMFAIEPGMGILNDWKVSTDLYERELHRRTVRREGYIELDMVNTVHRSIEPQVLTYIDIRRMFYTLGSDACALVPLQDGLPNKSNNYMVMSKGRSKLLETINSVMQVLNEAGTTSRLKRKWLGNGQGMCSSSGHFKQMTLAEVFSVLVIVPLAAVCSVVIFAIESVYYKVQKCMTIDDYLVQ